jgi:carbamoyltransferase
MITLGINAFHGDAAAALVRDGELVAAAEEERFNRHKHSAGMPIEAVRYCLREAGVDIGAVDHIAISKDPSANLLDKILYSLARLHRQAKLIRDRLGHVSKVRDVLAQLAHGLGVERTRIRAPLHNVEHHLCHVASAFLVSPFEDAALLSIDGFGDFVSTLFARGHGGRIEPLERIEFPHSLGVFYTMLSQYLGFPKYGDEGKVMGLAGCGQPVFRDEMSRILRLERDGTFELGLDFFRHHRDGVEMSWDEGTPVIGPLFSDRMADLLGPPREPGTPLAKRHQDIAASMQAALEEALFALLGRLHRSVPSPNLALAGGVALNAVANGMIQKRTPFRELFIQPAAGDAGTAIGAAFWVSVCELGEPRRFHMRHAYWGPAWDDQACQAALDEAGLQSVVLDDPATRAADLVAAGRIVGWFQGRMEVGPRALGNRSILADPRRATMKDVLNSRIKHREPFRPFAPSVLEERAGEWFEGAAPSPFMLQTSRVRADRCAEIPAVTHVDGTARLQTVAQKDNPRYHELLCRVYERTDTPVVLNTSFNDNEPIVCTPRDAVRCFTGTRMDALFLGNRCVER